MCAECMVTWEQIGQKKGGAGPLGMLYLVLTFFIPLIQTIYETVKGDRTQKLIITIGDNRMAKEK